MNGKHIKRSHKLGRVAITLMLALFLTLGIALGAMLPVAMAEVAQVEAPAGDPSPAIFVAQKNANSVVGIVTNQEVWNRRSRVVERTTVSSGSGVVYREGGYILTNQHVVESGSGFQVLLPSGELVDAALIGSDSVSDIAILKIDEKAAEGLVPVEVGSSEELLAGSTVVAIGNPGGENLANTVTQGIVSAVNRNSVAPTRSSGRNYAERASSYIQHDAAINPGNSGGGLFNYKGQLVGLNNWKVMSTGYSMTSTEGLGFAIPVETAVRIAGQLIDTGKVTRPAMGVTVNEVDGPDEPLSNFPPKSVVVYTVREGGAAEKSGMKPYDFIYSINDVRVTTVRELTTELDKFQAGDTITIRVVRFRDVVDNTIVESDGQVDPFGLDPNAMNLDPITVSGGYEFVDLTITLEVLE